MPARVGLPNPNDAIVTAMTSRRAFIKTCALASLVPLVGCRTARPVGEAGAQARMIRVDLSFAERLVAGAGLDELAAHPAAAALARHQAMSGNPDPDPRAIVEEILDAGSDPLRTQAVLKLWRERRNDLALAMHAASEYLPPDSPTPHHLYAVTGYDIGVAAPPDVVLNAGHERFLADPSEGIYYACHEAHHVGFLHHRTMPDLTALGGPGILGQVVDFITQMEGMAVHAAKPLREAAGAMDADPDYEVYRSREKAAAVTAAWRALRARCGTTEPDEGALIGEVLDAMTSGGRLAYQYGALVCETFEATQTRAALAETVKEPARFFAAQPKES